METGKHNRLFGTKKGNHLPAMNQKVLDQQKSEVVVVVPETEVIAPVEVMSTFEVEINESIQEPTRPPKQGSLYNIRNKCEWSC